MDGQTLTEIYRAQTAPQAFILQQALEEAGIRAVVENDLLQGGIGEITLGWSSAPRIMVQSSDAPRARDIIERSEQATTAAVALLDGTPDTCLACGKPMPAGNERCSACGWTYRSGEPDGEEG